MDGGAQAAPSERRPGGPERTSGDGAGQARADAGRCELLSAAFEPQPFEFLPERRPVDAIGLTLAGFFRRKTGRDSRGVAGQRRGQEWPLGDERGSNAGR